MEMRFDIGLRTDPGPRKGVNQDSILAAAPEDRPDSVLLIVADGMGGAKAGEHASREAVTVIYDQLIGAGLPSRADAAARLRSAVLAANASIFEKSQRSLDMEGMGCTVVAALVLGDQYWIASVGDSRAYLVRNWDIFQLTNDHTWVGARVREGALTPSQAERHSLRHVLDRALGTRPTVEVDVWPDDMIGEGDILILCTDGLHGVLSEEAIASLVLQHEAQDAADVLVEYALKAPTHDNVSVIVLHVTE
jgi:protein phosphatase